MSKMLSSKITSAIRPFVLGLATGTCLMTAGLAQETPQPYAGLDERPISSLSEADIDTLRTGGGWGLALPAELNGFPGPAHLLELADEIGLSASQERAVESLYETMKNEAIAAGERLIEAERNVDLGFQSRTFDEATLLDAIQVASSARAALRYVHLSHHLRTVAVITPQQIATYNRLRGYGLSLDPCANMPEGHDEAMWRLHNSC